MKILGLERFGFGFDSKQPCFELICDFWVFIR